MLASIAALAVVLVAGASLYILRRPGRTHCTHCFDKPTVSKGGFKVYDCPTPNVGKGTNSVEGVVLHHTSFDSAKKSVNTLTAISPKGVSSHVVIGFDGSRYVLAKPTKVTWHAGRSRMNGKDYCNNFTIGVEFVGNTKKKPLTEAQISSAIEYLLPIIKQHDIPLGNITTHHAIRAAWNEKHPDKTAPDKPDITEKEYQRFMNRLKASMKAG